MGKREKKNEIRKYKYQTSHNLTLLGGKEPRPRTVGKGNFFLFGLVCLATLVAGWDDDEFEELSCI